MARRDAGSWQAWLGMYWPETGLDCLLEAELCYHRWRYPNIGSCYLLLSCSDLSERNFGLQILSCLSYYPLLDCRILASASLPTN